MLKELRTLFSPPVFPEDEDKTRQAKYSHVIAIAFLGLALAFELFVRAFAGYAAFSWFDVTLLGVAALCVTGLHLLRKGHVRFTSILLVTMVWLASNGLALTGYGAKDASYLINFAIVLMAGLLLGWKASLFVTFLSILSGIALAYAEQNWLVVPTSYPVTAFARDIAFVFALNGVLIFLLIRGMETALRRSRLNLAQLETANAALNSTQNELQGRSSELLRANERLQKRTKKLQAVALLARSAASMPSFKALVASIPGAIHKQLGYEHVRLFLLDERKEFLILQANSAEAWNNRPEETRLPVQQSGSIGFVLHTSQPRLLPSTETDVALIPIPGLPNPHFTLLLPLKAGEEMIGILDIRSSEPGGFTEDDMSVLAILADQLAITLQNLLLYEQTQSALRKADHVAIQASAEAWSGYKNALEMKGYRYDGIKSEPLKSAQLPGKRSASLAVPIRLRGQTIGSFKLNPSDPSRAWTDDELAMVNATAERVALALEGARLLEEAQKRATREAFLSDVSTRLSASFQLDSILRDTVQELGQALRNSKVTFQLVNPADYNPPSEENTNGRATQQTSPGADHE